MALDAGIPGPSAAVEAVDVPVIGTGAGVNPFVPKTASRPGSASRPGAHGSHTRGIGSVSYTHLTLPTILRV